MRAEQAREWIEHSPQRQALLDLVGWKFERGGDNPECMETEGGPWFMCAGCMARLLARGCGSDGRDVKMVWKGQAHSPDGCAVCGKVTKA